MTPSRSEYNARHLSVLEGLEAVRKRPGMYIGSTDSRGLMHCLWEIIDNSVDEALAGYGQKITVILHRDGCVEVHDDGRGIPIDVEPRTGLSGIEVVFTKLHAGGKFGGGSYTASGGLHGVGASVVNALSSRLDVRVDRGGKTYQMSFKRGEPGRFTDKSAPSPHAPFEAFTHKPELEVVGKAKRGVTGTRIRYWADEQIFTPDAKFSSEELVRRARNGGFGANVNTGLGRVRTPLALVLNSDLIVGERFVAQMLDAAHPWHPCVVAPRVLSADGTEQHSGRHFPSIGHQTVEWLSPLARWRHTRALHELVGHDTRVRPDAVTSVDWVVGAAMLLPVEQVRAVGGFDEGYFMNAEEVDLQRRLREHGIPSLVAGWVSVVHAGGGSSDAAHRRTWLVDARARYARRWGHPRALAAALTAATGANLVVNTARAAAGRDVHPVRVAREELALVHPALRARTGGAS